MTLLNGFTKIVILLVTLSFLLVVYNWINKYWQEGLENMGEEDHVKSADHGDKPPPSTLLGHQHRPHTKHGGEHSKEKPREVKPNTHYRYKQYIPDHLDHKPRSQKEYEQIGKNFIKAEAESRGIKEPHISDSEMEALGRSVWRIYAAEIAQKRAHSPKNHDELMHQEATLLNKVSQIMHSETDYMSSKKCASIIRCAKEMPSDYLSNNYTHGRTTNMYGYKPSQENPVKRKVGYALSGRPLHGAPTYSHLKSAITHCMEDRTCGGINYNTKANRYELMPHNAHLKKSKHMIAYIKNPRHKREDYHDYSRDHPDDYRHDDHDHRSCRDVRHDHRHDKEDVSENEDDEMDKWYNIPYGENEYQRQYSKECHHPHHHKHSPHRHRRQHGDRHHSHHYRRWDRFDARSGGYGGGPGAREILREYGDDKRDISPWRPRDPNLLPKPYNSLMDLFR